MLRTLYFSLALISAACFTFGGIGGLLYEAHLMFADTPEISDPSQTIGWIITSGGALGYIIASFLFVREDDKTDIDEEPQTRSTDER